MLNTLLESKPRKQRKAGGTLFSVAFHSLIVFFAVYATARASVPEVRENREQKVTYIKTVKPEPAPIVEKKAEPAPPKAQPKAKAQPKTAPAPAVAPPRGFKVLEAPVNVPTEIPAIDLSAKVTNEADFSGIGTPGGSATGSGSAAVAGAVTEGERSYASFEVEREVSAISGTRVDYPESMRSAGTEGQVFAEFVVNENGRVETSTFRVIESSGPAFTSAVKSALSRMRFRPAQIGKTNVSQVVQQAFVFKLDR